MLVQDEMFPGLHSREAGEGDLSAEEQYGRRHFAPLQVLKYCMSKQEANKYTTQAISLLASRLGKVLEKMS